MSRVSAVMVWLPLSLKKRMRGRLLKDKRRGRSGGHSLGLRVHWHGMDDPSCQGRHALFIEEGPSGEGRHVRPVLIISWGPRVERASTYIHEVPRGKVPLCSDGVSCWLLQSALAFPSAPLSSSCLSGSGFLPLPIHQGLLVTSRGDPERTTVSSAIINAG